MAVSFFVRRAPARDNLPCCVTRQESRIRLGCRPKKNRLKSESRSAENRKEIFVIGSFVKCKNHPHDIGGCLVCDLMRLASGHLQRELNLLDPHKIWIWDPSSRMSFRGDPKKQLPMWHQDRVDLDPHTPGLRTGIQDTNSHDLEFPAAFRQRRSDGKPQDIVRIEELKR